MTDINELIRMEKEAKEALAKGRAREEAINKAELLTAMRTAGYAFKMMQKLPYELEGSFTLPEAREWHDGITSAKACLDAAVEEMERALIKMYRSFSNDRKFCTHFSEGDEGAYPGDIVTVENRLMKVLETEVLMSINGPKSYRYLLTDANIREL